MRLQLCPLESSGKRPLDSEATSPASRARAALGQRRPGEKRWLRTNQSVARTGAGSAQSHASMPPPASVSHLESSDQSRRELFAMKYNKLAIKGADLRENERNGIPQQVLFLQRRVTYT